MNMKKSQDQRQTSERFSQTLDGLLRNLADTGRGLKQALSMGADATLAIVSLWLAYTLRHGLPFSDFRHTWYLFLLMPALTVAVFSGLGVYRWVIRSTNQRLFKQIIKGSILSGALLVVLFFLIPPDRSNPRSLFVIYSMLLLLSTAGIRMLWRGLFDSGERGAPTAIYGAGAGGIQLANMLRGGGDYRPVVFIDDDVKLTGSTVSGLPVLIGSNPALKHELKRHDVQGIVLAIPSLSSAAYQRKLSMADSLGFHVQTMPSVAELMSGTARMDEIREVSISDILGRSEVVPDVELMSRRVTGKTVLVTGGGGSIGSELCRQVMKLAPRQLLILDNSEANLYHITEEFNTIAKDAEIDGEFNFKPILGSVTNKRRINKLMADYAVDTVFHAAAYKHVPIVEAQPDQGVAVNVFGTSIVLDAAIAHGVSDFLLISTDKAVRPTNAMGGSKRVAELILQAKARLQNTTRISMVRFGNVLGSSGSVVPKFQKQINAGGPITLTHRNITRYFMTIPEAAQLVLQASAIAKGGDVFVLDMGEPVRIEELARTMVRLYGKKLKEDTGNPADIDIVIEGLRPGEKMYEELFISDSCEQTEVAKISSADETWMPWNELVKVLDELESAAAEEDSATIKSLIMTLAFAGHKQPDAITADTVDAQSTPDLMTAQAVTAVS